LLPPGFAKTNYPAMHEPAYTKLSIMRSLSLGNVAMILAPALLLAAGCANGRVTADPSNDIFSISPGTGFIDTNCTGCNALSEHGTPAEQFTATLTGGGEAPVAWSLSGGDASSGSGSITDDGLYSPPSYLTADRVDVVVTATLNSATGASTTATAVLTLTPGFLQPLTPENVALPANGQVTVTGYLAEAGGYTGINFALASSPTGSSGGQGTLGGATCQRGNQAFTYCSVTYSAPALVSSTAATYVVATVGSSSSKDAAEVLLNSAGISSNPANHQSQSAMQIPLGSSGGNNRDYDIHGNQIVDCCSGTLGALIQDSNNRQYLLSNNHVLARSDHAAVGDAIIQPGLIDNNCTPNGDGAGTTPVGTLTSWLSLKSSTTNADAAIAQVNSGAVSASGSILEFGTRQPDGTLAAAPPGISSTGGKGETAWLNQTVAKSGRTTGLTCAAVSALDVDISVDYYRDCAETRPYLTKTFTHQLAVSGNQFSDAGDSGALVVDAGDAEPVGLYFAGGRDLSGVSQGVANPASDVLSELSAQAVGTSYTYVGAADHPVSCLNYGDNTLSAAQSRTLTDQENARMQQALTQAHMLVNSSSGVLGVATGKSSDHPGEGAITLYVDENMNANTPATVDGVRTLVIPATAFAVAFSTAPQVPAQPGNGAPALSAAVLNSAIAIKQQVAQSMMRVNSAFFGVGIGQSLDNPREAALVVYVDRRQVPAQLPATVDGLRIRYIVMDRMHVTRSYAAPIRPKHSCSPPPSAGQPQGFDLLHLFSPRSLKLN
jgi:hypothetical protein